MVETSATFINMKEVNEIKYDKVIGLEGSTSSIESLSKQWKQTELSVFLFSIVRLFFSLFSCILQYSRHPSKFLGGFFQTFTNLIIGYTRKSAGTATVSLQREKKLKTMHHLIAFKVICHSQLYAVGMSKILFRTRKWPIMGQQDKIGILKITYELDLFRITQNMS